MPVPGPRDQFRPDPGYTNPGREQPHRFNHWERPGPVAKPGHTPGLMYVAAQGHILAPGTVRRMWRQAINYIHGGMNYSWTASAPSPGRGTVSNGYFITRALRYMTRNVYTAAGTDNSRYAALHTVVSPRVRSKPVTGGAGNIRNRPTVRNRLTSFGSRVPPLNAKVPAGVNE